MNRSRKIEVATNAPAVTPYFQSMKAGKATPIAANSRPKPRMNTPRQDRPALSSLTVNGQRC